MTAPGSLVMMTMKSGGDEFSGMFHGDYEHESFVGDNRDADLESRGYTGNPNLLFFETHADVGGPIWRDRAWFYTFYNHFRIDKAVSGVDRSVATDLGDFDNFGGKVTVRPSDRDRLIGYTQWGLKEKPNRGLSADVGPDSVLAQASWSSAHKGEWQRVWDDRTFTTAAVKQFGIAWPMVPQVDPGRKPAAPRHRHGTPERGRLVPRRQRRAAVHVRPLEAAGDGEREPLRARLRRQPRPEDRLRVPDRQRPVRVQCQLRARPLSRRQREPAAAPRRPGHAVQHAGRGRDRVRQPEPAPRGVLPGHVAPRGTADAEPGSPLRAAAHVLSGCRFEPALRRLLPDRGGRRPDERHLEHVGAAARADVRAGPAHGAEGALRPLLREPSPKPTGAPTPPARRGCASRSSTRTATGSTTVPRSWGPSSPRRVPPARSSG